MRGVCLCREDELVDGKENGHAEGKVGPNKLRPFSSMFSGLTVVCLKALQYIVLPGDTYIVVPEDTK